MFRWEDCCKCGGELEAVRCRLPDGRAGLVIQCARCGRAHPGWGRRGRVVALVLWVCLCALVVMGMAWQRVEQGKANYVERTR